MGTTGIDTSLNQLCTFSQRTVTEEEIRSAHQHAAFLSFDRCTSTAWHNIGKALAALPHLRTLTLLRCDAGDALLR